jgi:lysophospholipase L1-like esterase
MKKLAGPLISLLTLLLCLGVVEAGLRRLAPVPDPYAAIKQPNQYIKSEYPPNYRFRTAAEEGLPGMQGQSEFSTNNMGFRGDPLVVPKPAGEYRVFMIGGSTTECMYLDDSKALHSVLQSELAKHAPPGKTVKVYNAGKSGDASFDHISMLVHRIAHLQPDMITVFAGVNDLTASLGEVDYLHFRDESTTVGANSFRCLMTELQLGRRWYYLVKKTRRSDREIVEEIPSLSDYREKAKVRAAAPVAEAEPRPRVAEYENNLRTLAGVARAHGVRLVLMTQQSTWNSQVDPKIQDWHWMLYRDREGVSYRQDVMDRALRRLNDGMRRVAREQGTGLFDVEQLIPKSSQFFYDDCHFNVAGARRCGEGLAEYIRRERLLTSKAPLRS